MKQAWYQGHRALALKSGTSEIRGTIMRNAIRGLLWGVLLFSANALAVDGFAVSVAWRTAGYPWAPTVPECCVVGRGQLVRFDIKNSAVTTIDTLIDRDQFLVEYPVINLDGTQIAFIRSRYSVQSGKLVNAGQCYLSVINKDGTGLRNLVAIADPPGDAMCQFGAWCGTLAPLDWPAGRDIYYVNPSAPREIWRVNVDQPSQNVKVVAETNAFRRFSLSLDAKHMGEQLLNVGGSAIKSFPGLAGEVGNCGCNGAGSASGKYLLNYCGWHGTLFFTCSGTLPGPQNIQIWEIGNWSGAELCRSSTQPVESHCGGELMHWSVNSDKWSSHWPGIDGWADGIHYGTNHVLVNWIDKQAIALRVYPKVSGSDAGALFYGDYGGDFWVSGPANCYEDVKGNWVPVGGTAVGRRGNGSATEDPRVDRSGDAIRIRLRGDRSWDVKITTIDGKTVLRGPMTGDIAIPFRAGPSNSMVLRATDGKRTIRRLITAVR